MKFFYNHRDVERVTNEYGYPIENKMNLIGIIEMSEKVNYNTMNKTGWYPIFTIGDPSLTCTEYKNKQEALRELFCTLNHSAYESEYDL